MNRSVHKSAAQSRTVVDAGLRAYMQKVFSTMGLGLLLTGATAYFVATTPALVELFLGSPLRWVLLIATFAIPLTIGVGIERLSSGAAQGLFWGYAVLMGVTTSVIFLGYTTDSIARIFLITSCMFGGMSLYGYTTHRDLTAWGSFLFMGLFGLVISSIVNVFVGSSPFQMALSVISVILFTGLTAYDVQMIRRLYQVAGSAERQGKFVILGALSLYLDFINMFLSLLRLFGDRR